MRHSHPARLPHAKWLIAAQLALLVVFVFCSFMPFVVAYRRYPLLDQNDPIYLRALLAPVVISSGLLYLFRFGNDASRGIRFIAIVGLSVPVAFLVLGSILCWNGAMDGAPATQQTCTVVRAVDEPRNRHYMLSAPGAAQLIKLELPVRAPLTVRAGGHITLVIKPGSLGHPWVASHNP
jgi:hypothetical protein